MNCSNMLHEMVKNLPIIVSVAVICICVARLKIIQTLYPLSLRVLFVWSVQQGRQTKKRQQKRKEKKQQDIIGSKASGGGIHSCTVCVVSNCEVGGEVQQAGGGGKGASSLV
ncbi:hypothetical protein ILYODFUR_030916 [Ilyodon furcidens]|uniref:Uncharacterized protein n=1 Tax=Ilyodon furcidens TaxID=33524 RepID=A0ABV0UWN7_9TELE